MSELEKKPANNVSVIMDSLLDGMNAVLASKTVVGEPAKVGDVIILPLVDVTFGVGAGATLGKDHQGGNKGAGGGGLGGKMSPTAVLVIKDDGSVRLVNVKNQDAVSKAIELVPEVLDKLVKKDKGVSDKEVLNAAFPDKVEE